MKKLRDILFEIENNKIEALKDDFEDVISDLENASEKIDFPTEEAVDPLSILSYILASTTLSNLISGWARKVFKKYNMPRGEAGAKWIEHNTHKFEESMKKSIEGWIGLFTDDDRTKRITANGIFVLLLIVLGYKAGLQALEHLKHAEGLEGGVSTLKAVLKGKDIQIAAGDIASALKNI